MSRQWFRVTLLCVGGILACGGGDTSGLEEPGEPTNLSITQEPGDTTAVTEAYPNQFAVEITDQDRTPVPGQLVNFASVPEGCARTQSGATSLETNDQGAVSFAPVADTLASTSIGPCFLKAVLSAQGQATLSDSVQTTILPGPISDLIAAGSRRGTPDSTFTWPADAMWDQYDNPGLWRMEVSTVDSFPVIENSDTAWVTRPSTEVIAVQGSIPGTPEARTLEELVSQDEQAYAAVCFVGGRPPQDSLLIVTLAEMGPNMGIQAETHWSAAYPDGQITLGPEHCPQWSP